MSLDENNLCTSSDTIAHFACDSVLSAMAVFDSMCIKLEQISEWYAATTKLLNPRKTCHNAFVQSWYNAKNHRFEMNRSQPQAFNLCIRTHGRDLFRTVYIGWFIPFRNIELLIRWPRRFGALSSMILIYPVTINTNGIDVLIGFDSIIQYTHNSYAFILIIQ